MKSLGNCKRQAIIFGAAIVVNKRRSKIYFVAVPFQLCSMATATPGDAHLTVVLDLAPFASGSKDVAVCAALQACQRVIARVLALCLRKGTGLQWLFRFVDSRVPPHAFTCVADLIKASSAGRAE